MVRNVEIQTFRELFIVKLRNYLFSRAYLFIIQRRTINKSLTCE